MVRALQAAALTTAQQRSRPVRRRRSWLERSVIRSVTSFVVLGIITGAGAVYRHFEHSPSEDRYPKTWDPRVRQLVSFVEGERDLTFDHPVHVDFRSEAEFVAIFDPVEYDDETSAQIDEQAAVTEDLKDAAGLSATIDVVADEATVSQVGTLGFYDPYVERITIRGNDVTPAVQAVLVHELTHALQDQKYELETGGPDDFQVRSVVEADAMRIEDAYVEKMSPEDQEQVFDENFADEGTDKALSDVPWTLVDERQAPYILGPMFIDHIIESGGIEALDDVFVDVPTSEELVNPTTYTSGPDAPLPHVPTPPGAEVVQEVAAWSMYDALVMLDAWLPWRDSRTVLDGWSSAAYIVYQHDYGAGPVCFTAVVQFDTAEQAAGYGAAISAWAAAAGSPTVPTVADLGVNFEACPRPEGAVDPPTPTLMTSEALYVEHAIIEELDVTGVSTTGDWFSCVARALLDDPTVTSLTWVDEVDITPEQQEAIYVATDTARWMCGAPPVV